MPNLFADNINMFATGCNQKDLCCHTQMCTSKLQRYISLLEMKLWKWLKSNFLVLSLIANDSCPYTSRTSAKSFIRGRYYCKRWIIFDHETMCTLYHTFYPYLNYTIHVWRKAYFLHVHDLVVLRNMACKITSWVVTKHKWEKALFWLKDFVLEMFVHLWYRYIYV